MYYWNWTLGNSKEMILTTCGEELQNSTLAALDMKPYYKNLLSA
jgi:hypothetical protein